MFCLPKTAWPPTFGCLGQFLYRRSLRGAKGPAVTHGDAAPKMKPLLRTLSCLLLPIALTGCWTYVSPEASKRFEARPGRFSVTVYPVHVACGGKTMADFQLGRELVDWLNAQKIADATPGRLGAPIPVKWGANQAKMAKQSAEAFGAWVKQANIATDYALLVEILCNPNETKVMGVHFFLAEKSGLLAAGGLTNSHWDEFKRVKPVDRQGGLSVLKEMIKRRWPEAK